MNEHLPITGNLTITLYDEHGNIKDKREVQNLVVSAGTTFIASRMASASATVMSHMAVGTDNTAASSGQTALITELARVSLTSATPSSNTITYVGDFPAGTGTGALTEAGIFNAGTSGTMLARTVFSVVNKGAADVMNISWTITIG